MFNNFIDSAGHPLGVLGIQDKGRNSMKKTYQIEVDCANCANKMEEETKKIQGITNASINFVTQKFVVDFAEDSDHKSLRLLLLYQ